MAKSKRSAIEYLTSTVWLHAVHETDQNARIVLACVQARAVHNRCIAHIL